MSDLSFRKFLYDDNGRAAAYALLLGPYNGPKWPENRASPELDAKWPRRALGIWGLDL